MLIVCTCIYVIVASNNDVNICVIRRVSYKKQELLTFHPRFFDEVRSAHVFSFLDCVFALCLVLNVAFICGLSILDCHFGFLLRLLITTL
jgi:hypothetical protein